MEEDGLKTNNKPWLFKKGNPGGPGRPKGSGKSLKQYTREYLADMTDEERLDFLEGLPKVDIWKMSEGNPETTNELNVKGELKIEISEDIAKKYDSTQKSENSGSEHSEIQSS